ncbi:MAG: RNA-binding S4 domain-containing protein [Firmicutes bacterium]|nr:RNA-binding S4 domain-containing protein [Bacillota bacterium]
MGEKTTDVKITTATIGLDQFLKWAQVAGSGGEAKQLIQNKMVLVNGRYEDKRSRQLVRGDVVEVEGRGRFRLGG